jgi:hypothetical protein
MESWKRIGLLGVSAAWLMVATAGFLWLADYDSQPGAPANPPQRWPDSVSLARNFSKPTLLMFLHPRCPCSRASLYELARLAHDERDQFDLYVLFVQPSEVAANWSTSALWETATSCRDLQVVIDQGGRFAQQFGAKASGQVLIYDRAGVLQFDGGITPGRGHAGDSIGRSNVRAIAAGQTLKNPANCATFGCSLSANITPNGG